METKDRQSSHIPAPETQGCGRTGQKCQIEWLLLESSYRLWMSVHDEGHVKGFEGKLKAVSVSNPPA